MTGENMSAFEPIVVFSGSESARSWEFENGANLVRCLLAADQTAGRLSFFESVLAPGTRVLAHTHREEDEYWYMLDDGIRVRMGDSLIEISAGTVVAIPAGTLHEVTNASDAPVRSVIFTTPGGLEHFFAGLDGLLRSSDSKPGDFAELFASTGTSFPR